MSTLGNSVELVRKRRGVEIDIEKIPMDDKKTFEHLAKGETIGLFQLGGFGHDQILERVKTDNRYRHNGHDRSLPTRPMANIPTYIKRKHGQEK